ncbi:MAG: hypothetical protein ACTS6J_22660 [Burkholderiales bacterium]
MDLEIAGKTELVTAASCGDGGLLAAARPGQLPPRAFSVEYASKDLSYAPRPARESAVNASGARKADGWLRQAIEAGDGELYFPVISRLIGRKH